jgi:CheY-like chemotaxis protein
MNESASGLVLLAEDDGTDVLLARRAFAAVGLTNPVHVVSDGHAAIEFMTRASAAPGGILPALAILDFKMPGRDGIQVLQWMRAQPTIRCVPAIVFSSSPSRADIDAAYEAGANAFIIKPSSIAARAEWARFIQQWLAWVEPALVTTEGFQAAMERRGSRPG